MEFINHNYGICVLYSLKVTKNCEFTQKSNGKFKKNNYKYNNNKYLLMTLN